RGPAGAARRRAHLRARRRPRAAGVARRRARRRGRLRRHPHEPDPVLPLRSALGRACPALGREPHSPGRRRVPPPGGGCRPARPGAPLSARAGPRRARRPPAWTVHRRSGPRPGALTLLGAPARPTGTHRRKQVAMASQMGDIAPDFTQWSTEGPIHFHEYVNGKWAVLFSHPKDFTPVCTTELGAVAKLKAEFEKRNCRVIAISVDDTKSHKGWIG